MLTALLTALLSASLAGTFCGLCMTFGCASLLKRAAGAVLALAGAALFVTALGVHALAWALLAAAAAVLLLTAFLAAQIHDAFGAIDAGALAADAEADL